MFNDHGNSALFNHILTTYKSDDGKYYAKLEYDYEDHIGNLHHVLIPKIVLPFVTSDIFIDGTMSWPSVDLFHKEDPILKVGGYEFRIESIKCVPEAPDREAYRVDRIIKKAPPKEMTLSEIEKKLGYSVKIVSGKDDT